MNEILADEIFQLSIEAQRIDNRKWEIRTMSRHNGEIPSWDEVCAQAMKLKINKSRV